MSEGREMIDEIEAAGAAQDLLDAAFDVDEIWATIAEGLIERILISPLRMAARTNLMTLHLGNII